MCKIYLKYFIINFTKFPEKIELPLKCDIKGTMLKSVVYFEQQM